VLELLTASHRVIALDLPGFGGSSKPRLEYSAEFSAAGKTGIIFRNQG
jgi:pimeloyl-ACP methyl ester carboxylesterase